MLWSKKPAAPPVHDRSRLVGLDLNASRARAVSVGGGKTRTLLLDGTAEELSLSIHLDRRPPEVGRAAVAVSRKLPHAVLGGYLPLLGQPRTWPAGRLTLTPEAAVGATLDRLRGPVAGESDAAAFALPAYLTPQQVGKLVELAIKAKLPVRGTAAAALAVAAHRANAVLGGSFEDAVPIGTERTDGSSAPTAGKEESDHNVELRPSEGGPGAVVVIDADDAALSAVGVLIEPDGVRLLGSAAWPKLNLKAWTDRLLDGISDRCVRVCRRDPRDSADAEQLLADQLPDTLDLSNRGHPVILTVRSAHWYQDLPHRPADFESYCTALAKSAADGLRELVWSLPLQAPPRAVWLTPAAARLPGLTAAVHRGSPERTGVESLSETAVAEAAAALAARWQAGSLPRAHLDTSIPFDTLPTEPPSPGDVPYARRAAQKG